MFNFAHADFAPKNNVYNVAIRTGTSSSNYNYSCFSEKSTIPINATTATYSVSDNFPSACRAQQVHASLSTSSSLRLWYGSVQQESCPTNSILQPSGKCQCDSNHPHQRFNSGTQEFSCSNTTSNQDDGLIALLAASLGLSIAAATGLFTSFTACVATIICGGALALGSIFLALSALSFNLGDSTDEPPPPANSQLEVRLVDSSVPPMDGAVLLNPGGSIKAPANSTTQGTIKTFTNPDGSTVTIDEASSTVFTSKTNADGSTTSTLITNSPEGATILISQSESYGTAPDGTPVTQHTFTQNEQPITPATTSSAPSRSETTFSNNGSTSSSPPAGTTRPNTGNTGGNTGGGTGGSGTGTGTGTGSGTGSGTGDCASYGCAKESTQLQVLNSITQNVPAAVQNTAKTTADSLRNDFEIEDTVVYGKLTNALNGFIDSTGIDDAFAPLNSFSPFADTYSNCSFTSNWFGNRTFSYCDEQPMIHTLLSYMFFVYFSMRIFTLVVNARGQTNTVF